MWTMTQNLTIHNFITTSVTLDSATILDQCLINYPSDVKSVVVFAAVSHNDHSKLAVTIKHNKAS